MVNFSKTSVLRNAGEYSLFKPPGPGCWLLSLMPQVLGAILPVAWRGVRVSSFHDVFQFESPVCHHQ